MKKPSVIVFLIIAAYLFLLLFVAIDSELFVWIEQGKGHYLSSCPHYRNVSAYLWNLVPSTIPPLIGLGVILGFRFRLNAGWSLLVLGFVVAGYILTELSPC